MLDPNIQMKAEESEGLKGEQAAINNSMVAESNRSVSRWIYGGACLVLGLASMIGLSNVLVVRSIPLGQLGVEVSEWYVTIPLVGLLAPLVLSLLIVKFWGRRFRYVGLLVGLVLPVLLVSLWEFQIDQKVLRVEGPVFSSFNKQTAFKQMLKEELPTKVTWFGEALYIVKKYDSEALRLEIAGLVAQLNKVEEKSLEIEDSRWWGYRCV